MLLIISGVREKMKNNFVRIKKVCTFAPAFGRKKAQVVDLVDTLL